MLYTFKSDATSDLIMLPAHAKLVLEVIGKDFGHTVDATGIITPAQMPQAIAALQRAMQQADAQAASAPQPKASNDDEQDDDAPGEAQTVTLRQRATPFLQMLERSLAANAAVTWGV